MSINKRSTRECEVRQVKPAIRRALQAYFQKHNLGELETECLLCCETASEGLPNGLDFLFKVQPERPSTTVVVLTASALVWARANDPLDKDPTVVGADLMNIQARGKLSFFTGEVGLEIMGWLDGAKSNIRGTIGLGPEEASQKLCDEVSKAIERVNPKPVQKYPKWMGGR